MLCVVRALLLNNFMLSYAVLTFSLFQLHAGPDRAKKGFKVNEEIIIRDS